nr:hypothetical protein GCM10020063_001560 [Dactylosporangium thailandense]
MVDACSASVSLPANEAHSSGETGLPLRQRRCILATLGSGPAGGPDRSVAPVSVIRAALEQLSGGEGRELALDLPIELAGHVTQHDGQAHPQPLRDFTRHPRERTGLNQDEVTRGLRVVLATLSGLPDSARVRHALGRLPAEYRELAGTGA